MSLQQLLRRQQKEKVTNGPKQSGKIPDVQSSKADPRLGDRTTPSTPSSSNQSMEICEEHAGKRQFVDEEGFIKPSKTCKSLETTQAPPL